MNADSDQARTLTGSYAPGVVRSSGRESPSGSGIAVEASGVSVAFGGTQALCDARLAVRPGTVHAVLGENGSGKSTLIKVLAGVYQARPGGVITVGARAVGTALMTPDTAYELGLRFVHQDLGLFDDMTIAENIALYSGYPTQATGNIRWRALRQRVAALLDRFDIDAAPSTPVGRLRPAMRTMVAIARALQDDSDGANRVLVLDEPTVSLPAHEADLLLTLLRGRASRGDSVVFVSHRLQEVLAAADEMTILRDGRTVAVLDASATTEQEVGRLIAGRAVERLQASTQPESERPVVARIEGLSAGHVSGVDLQVHAGEFVGLAGLLGSGRSTILRALFGLVASSSGSVTVGSRSGRPFRTPAQAMAASVAYVPEDRVRDGAFMDMSVSANLSISVLERYFRWLWLRQKGEQSASEQLIDQFGIRCGTRRSALSTLSGGNQQKVVLARWLQRQPKLLLLDEPTQGVDVAARSDIYKVLRSAADEGCGVIIASSDLEELSELCDRVCMLSNGRIVEEFRPPRTTPAELFERVHASGKGTEQ
jgi:ribose transport system ATP-binding protein